MSSVQEIETAINALEPRERDTLLLWIEKQFAQDFDEQIQRDLQSGGLDHLIDQARSEIEAGQAREL